MKWLNEILDLIYPRTCEACNETLLGGEYLICTKCMIDLPRSNSHFEKINTIEKKFWGKIPVSNTITYLKFAKKSRVQKLLHELKYRNKPEVGVVLGELYGRDLKASGFDERLDLIIGVPLHPEKKKQRGYNQADYIAEGLSKGLGVPYETKAVVRTKNSTSQTKKSRYGRFLNTENVFEVVEKDLIKNKRIAVVDDVLTTGSTIESLGKCLLENGCKEISVITIAAVF